VSTVVWHDLECGGYVHDLPLWRELARSPVLDVGAGTGRVALALARAGLDVVALDADPVLVDELRRRAAGLPVEAVCADARGFDLAGRRFATILCPMQTVQLLGGPAGRAAFLRAAAGHLAPGGRVACALADAREGMPDPGAGLAPLPDMREIDGVLWSSTPVDVRDEGDAAAIARVREVVQADGTRTVARDVVRLDHLDAATLEREAAACGLRALARRTIPATADYVGSDVVVLAR
jgi:SAM-dependent methyltransferase